MVEKFPVSPSQHGKVDAVQVRLSVRVLAELSMLASNSMNSIPDLIVRSALFPETIPVTSLVVRHSLPLNNAVLPTEAPLCCRPNMSRSLEPTV